MQPEFDFNPLKESSGLTQWKQDRLAALSALAKKAGLPLGENCEVWLGNGIRLRGRLQFQEELIRWETDDLSEVELEIGGVRFKRTEMESCVRID